MRRSAVLWIALLVVAASAQCDSSYAGDEALSRRLRDLSLACSAPSNVTTIGYSAGGRAIQLLRLGSSSPDAKTLLLYSGLDGLEQLGRELQLLLAERLCDGSAASTALLQQRRLLLVPTVNVDGYASGELHNSAGGRLLTDFPSRWAVQSQAERLDAAVQPETAALMSVIAEQRPHAAAYLSDGSGRLISYAFDASEDGESGSAAATADEPLLQWLSKGYAARSDEPQQQITNGAAWSALSGSAQDWAYSHFAVAALTVHLSATICPARALVQPAWEANSDSLLWLLRATATGVSGRLSSRAQLTVSTSDNELPPFLSAADGSFFRLLSPSAATTPPAVYSIHALLLDGSERQFAASAEVTAGEVTAVTFVEVFASQCPTCGRLSDGEIAAAVIVPIIVVAATVFFIYRRRMAEKRKAAEEAAASSALSISLGSPPHSKWALLRAAQTVSRVFKNGSPAGGDMTDSPRERIAHKRRMMAAERAAAVSEVMARVKLEQAAAAAAAAAAGPSASGMMMAAVMAKKWRRRSVIAMEAREATASESHAKLMAAIVHAGHVRQSAGHSWRKAIADAKLAKPRNRAARERHSRLEKKHLGRSLRMQSSKDAKLRSVARLALLSPSLRARVAGEDVASSPSSTDSEDKAEGATATATATATPATSSPPAAAGAASAVAASVARRSLRRRATSSMSATGRRTTRLRRLPSGMLDKELVAARRSGRSSTTTASAVLSAVSEDARPSRVSRPARTVEPAKPAERRSLVRRFTSRLSDAASSAAASIRTPPRRASYDKSEADSDDDVGASRSSAVDSGDSATFSPLGRRRSSGRHRASSSSSSASSSRLRLRSFATGMLGGRRESGDKGGGSGGGGGGRRRSRTIGSFAELDEIVESAPSASVGNLAQLHVSVRRIRSVLSRLPLPPVDASVPAYDELCDDSPAVVCRGTR
eukprot:PLAT1419.1.p1 GENE.PLAT1419.1~~PLAT1419.1.p1  ORF type:complete len:941 (-),score=254.16 PLAT1419.1:152-2974(-)